ncbi:abortive infection family protein [Pseudophaeobacter sp.]|uniref:abortive infection family protein n=1 Tax=Pseudophaeobacter sp. TaxID=1971739 RepID=UPI003A985A55
MAEWFEETFGIDVFQDRFQAKGTSKGNTLRGFVEVAEPRLVAQVLRGLWAYRCSREGCTEPDPKREAELKSWINKFTSELEQASALSLEESFRDFSGDTTLPKLRASIAADLIAENPEVAIDRVQTYCVKRFRTLLAERGVKSDPKAPLHALFGAYGKALKDEGAVSEYALPTLRVQHKLYEGLNSARNNRSFAHDNDLLEVSEAQFIVDTVLASLAFIERIEAARRPTQL